MSGFSLPELPVSKDLIERIQFSVSSRNAEAKVSECAAHLFGAKYTVDPSNVEWQYISSGVVCLLRSKELVKGGRKYAWSMSLCLYSADYSVLVWKGKLDSQCGYTDVADNFHVFELTEVNGLIGILFSDRLQASEHSRTYRTWHDERVREERNKGSATPPQQPAGPRFYKEMISRPCNFQHIQGTQAIDECLEIEKMKSDIQAAVWALAPCGRLETESTKRTGSVGKKRKELAKPKLQFDRIEVPRMSSEPLTVASTSSHGPSPLAIDDNGAYLAGDAGASLPYTTAPQVYQSDTYQPDTYQPDTYQPDTYQPDTYQPDTYQPDTYQPDTYQPDTYQPDTYQPVSHEAQLFTVPPAPPLEHGAPGGASSPTYNQYGSGDVYPTHSYSDPDPVPGSEPLGYVAHPVPTSPPSVVNGYPQEEGYQYYAPDPPPSNGYHGCVESQPTDHLGLDSELQQYMGEGGGAREETYRLDLTPPGRLSPLNLEKEFSAEIFASTIMSTH